MIQQLVCLSSDWGEFPKGYECNMLPKVDGIYTLVKIHAANESISFITMRLMDEPMISLDEIYFINRPGRPCFNAKMFRPTKTQSIDKFYDILKNPNAPISE